MTVAGALATSTAAEEDWAGIWVKFPCDVEATSTGKSSLDTEPGAPPVLARPDEDTPELPMSEGGMNRLDATRVEAGIRVLGIGWAASPTALDDVEPVVVPSANVPIEEQPESAAAPAIMPANAAARSAF